MRYCLVVGLKYARLTDLCKVSKVETTHETGQQIDHFQILHVIDRIGEDLLR